MSELPTWTHIAWPKLTGIRVQNGKVLSGRTCNEKWRLEVKKTKVIVGYQEALHKFMTYAKHIYWETLFAGGNIPKVSRALSHTMLAKRTQNASETSAYRLIITAQLEGLVPPQWFLWGTVSSPRLALTSQLDKDTELKFPLSFHQGFWEKNPIQNTIKVLNEGFQIEKQKSNYYHLWVTWFFKF